MPIRGSKTVKTKALPSVSVDPKAKVAAGRRLRPGASMLKPSKRSYGGAGAMR